MNIDTKTGGMKRVAGKAGIKGISNFEECIVSFKRQEDGTYVKQTKRVTRNHITSEVKYLKKNNPIIEEGPYKLVKSSDIYDDKVSFENFQGEKDFLYFKKIVEDIE